MKSTEIHKIHVPGLVIKHETAKKTAKKVTPVKQSPKVEEQKDQNQDKDKDQKQDQDNDKDKETPASVSDVPPPAKSSPEPQKEEEPPEPVIYDPPEWYFSNQLFV